MDLIMNRQAEITIDTFPPTDRECILKTIDQIKLYPTDIDLYNEIKRLTAEDKLYLMKATPDIMIILEIHNGSVEVLDVVRHDRLKKMFKH